MTPGPGYAGARLGRLTTAREVVGLSYDRAAARLGCEADWLIETTSAADPAHSRAILEQHLAALS